MLAAVENQLAQKTGILGGSRLIGNECRLPVHIRCISHVQTVLQRIDIASGGDCLFSAGNKDKALVPVPLVIKSGIAHLEVVGRSLFGYFITEHVLIANPSNVVELVSDFNRKLVGGFVKEHIILSGTCIAVGSDYLHELYGNLLIIDCDNCRLSQTSLQFIACSVLQRARMYEFFAENGHSRNSNLLHRLFIGC